jgi:hydroxymethylbilane synthase
MAEGRADLAVHSLKDVPMELPDGFQLAAVLEREDPRDAFVSNDYSGLAGLPAGSVVGTSSLRRQALVAARYPQLVIKPLRGNLDTRLAKLDRGDYAAIILAAAGLKRLGLERRIRAYLSPEDSLPAAGQGAMAIEILSGTRADGADLRALLSPLNHEHTAQAVQAERKVSKVFGASCQIPLAAHATIDGATLRLRAMVATPDGRRSAFAEAEGPAALPELLGEQVAQQLMGQDAEAILAECRLDAAGSAGDA